MKTFVFTLLASVFLFSYNSYAMKCSGTSLTFDVILDVESIKNSDQFNFHVWLGDVELEEPDIHLNFTHQLLLENGLITEQTILKKDLPPLKSLSLTMSGSIAYIEMIFAAPYSSEPEKAFLECGY